MEATHGVVVTDEDIVNEQLNPFSTRRSRFGVTLVFVEP
jgi:hypothetical protein